MKRVFLWDNLKFFAMLCIVLLHSTGPLLRIPVLYYIHPIINYIPMALFAIISGYWYKNKSFKELIIIYLWPCILFSIINNIFGSNSYFNICYPNSDYWAAFAFKAGPAMWYLVSLLFCSIVTKLIRGHIGITSYLVIACVIAMAIGFLRVPNRYFDIHRISCLFPCFVFGLWVKQKADNQLFAMRSRIGRILCAIVLLLCVLYNIFIIRYIPSMSGAFTEYYGLNIKAAFGKWIMMIVRVVACVCIIVLMPNKEYWFTKYGSRTMNVYLLHDTFIFLLCWGFLYNYRYEWFGLLSMFIGVPLLCSLLFSTPVDKFMKRILFTNYLRSIKECSKDIEKKSQEKNTMNSNAIKYDNINI